MSFLAISLHAGALLREAGTAVGWVCTARLGTRSLSVWFMPPGAAGSCPDLARTQRVSVATLVKRTTRQWLEGKLRHSEEGGAACTSCPFGTYVGHCWDLKEAAGLPSCLKLPCSCVRRDLLLSTGIARSCHHLYPDPPQQQADCSTKPQPPATPSTASIHADIHAQ